ncbi:hypothetical protein AX16_005898 [Volvariella volvacea WC 439]|nr:hypothetical protein AX16_005898 [Volvariella volvacea WC 439]
MRARIGIRKNDPDVEITQKRIEREVQRIQGRSDREPVRLELEDVLDALESGEEALILVNIEPVGYDYQFANTLMDGCSRY